MFTVIHLLIMVKYSKHIEQFMKTIMWINFICMIIITIVVVYFSGFTNADDLKGDKVLFYVFYILWTLPGIFIKLSFMHLMLKYKRIEVMTNPKYTEESQIIRQVKKEMCVARCLIFNYLLAPLIHITFWFFRLKYTIKDNNKNVSGMMICVEYLIIIFDLAVFAFVWRTI